jgi:predicted permease
MIDIISLLIANIIPLYILIVLGFIAGRWMDVNLPSMATVAIYILAPIVNFGAMAQMKFTPEYVALPIIFFIGSAVIGTLSYLTAQKIWKNNMANLIGMGSVTGNTMYFGLPVILALLGPEWVGVYALLNLGTFLNEVGLGYFFGARGNATLKGALLKVIKLPVIHAIWLGLLYNFSGLALPEAFIRYWDYSIGAWVIIGMMIIGVALAKQSRLEIDWKLILNMFAPKFILWPLFGFGVILIDMHYFHAFGSEVHTMLAVMTAVPLAGNLVAYAATLNLHPERAAAVVLLSTVFAFITVPAAVIIYQLLI